MRRPLPGGNEREDGANGSWFDYGREGLAEIHAGSLKITPDNPPGLVPVELAVGTVLVGKNPLSGDDLGARRTVHQGPSPVALERGERVGHGSHLVGFFQRDTHGVGNRCGRSCSSQSMFAVRLEDAILGACDHAVAWLQDLRRPWGRACVLVLLMGPWRMRGW
jgi:hypothetical protein